MKNKKKSKEIFRQFYYTYCNDSISHTQMPKREGNCYFLPFYLESDDYNITDHTQSNINNQFSHQSHGRKVIFLLFKLMRT